MASPPRSESLEPGGPPDKPTPRRRAKAKPQPDDATLAVREAIRAHVPGAIAELARLAHEATSEQARVSAINALIDRGYGSLKQTLEGDDAAHGITVRFVAPPEKP